MTELPSEPRPPPQARDEQPAAPAQTADAATSVEDLYRATFEELAKVAPKQSRWAAVGTLLATAALFVGASVYFSGNAFATTILYVLPVLFLHELGHYLGMRLFGYRDVTMFFIPFFGAAVSGQKEGAAVWQQVVMLLLGPLPGIFLALLLQVSVSPEPDDWLSGFVTMLVIINAFNLLPIKPLDGGRIVDLLFFARKPSLAVGFQGLTVLGLAWLAWSMRGGVATVIFGGLAVVMLLTLGSTYRDAVKAQGVRATPIALPAEFSMLTEPQRRELFGRAVGLNPAQGAPAGLAVCIRWIFDCIQSHPPRWPVQMLMFGLYLGGIGAAFAALVMPQLVPAEITAAEAAEWSALKAIRSDKASALADYKKARELREAHLAAHPRDDRVQSGLVHTLQMLATLQTGEEKLATYRIALSHCEEVTARFPSRPQRQARLAKCIDNVGTQLRALRRHEEALTQFSRSLAIRERLAASDPAKWQGDLANTYRDVGHLLLLLGKSGEAVTVLEKAVSLCALMPADMSFWKAVAHDDLADALIADGRQSDAVAHLALAATGYEEQIKPDSDLEFLYRDGIGRVTVKLGELLVLLGRTEEAVAAFRKGLASAEQWLLKTETTESKKGALRESTMGQLGSVTFAALRAREFERALAAADRAIALVPADLGFAAYRAHALMLQGKGGDARAIYFGNRGKLLATKRATPWEKKVEEDFRDLRKAGLNNPLMVEVEAAFAATQK